MSSEFLANFTQAFSYHQAGEWERARALYSEILSIEPENFEVLQLLGTLEAQCGNKEQAFSMLSQALVLKQDNPTVWFNYGNVLNELERYESAIDSYRRAIEIKLEYPETHYRLGLILNKLGRFEEAIKSHSEAIRFDSGHKHAHYYRGLLLHQFLLIDAAIASYQRVIALDPSYAQAYWNMGLALLVKGDFEEGWKLFEWRWQQDFIVKPLRTFKVPRWTGTESLKNKTILLHGEQGLGDKIQFCRYATLVAQAGARVVFEVPKPLVGLFKELDGVAQIIESSDTLPEVDYECSLLSLPLAFKTNLVNIPCATPYLKADHEKVSQWQTRLGPKRLPRVGIVWSGSAGHTNDANRSVGLEEFIRGLPRNIQYISLQKEIREPDKIILQQNPQILNFSAELNDFSDTAALVRCLDLVISVDTSVAHLSGALGVQTWILLSFVPDWRWMLDRADSPWYPSVKLFRQRKLSDWSGVLERIKNTLSEGNIFHPTHLITQALSDGVQNSAEFIGEQIQHAFLVHQRGETQAAKQTYEDILSKNPRHFDALQLLGIIEAQQGNAQRALALLDRAIEINQSNSVVFNNHGNVLSDLNQETAAIASFDRAIALKPDYAEAYCNRGLVHKKLDQHTLAIEDYDQAITLNPDYVDAFCNRGISFLKSRQFRLAQQDFARAMAISPDYAFAGFNQSLGLLLLGDYKIAWPLYELRWKLKAFPSEKRNFKQPLWLGQESLKNKIILLYSEQGLGDTIQFCRYASLVAGLGARVILEVPAPLVTLLKNIKGVSKIVAFGDALPDFDFQCPLMSLPLAFKTTLENIPSSSAYLKSDKKKVATWRARLGKKTKPRIGLVWSGSASHRNDSNRSLLLEALIPFLPPHFQYVVLQKDIKVADQTTLSLHPEFLEFATLLADFSETAALVECMDVVVSVDTSVAHLCAALGKNTWIMIAYLQDWRWLLDRADSPWYQSVRLFRQDEQEDWTGVLKALQHSLMQFSPAPLTSENKIPPVRATSILLQQAFQIHQQGDLDAASALYAEILKVDTNHFDALQLLGAIEAQRSNTERAYELLSHAVTLNQSNPVVWRNFGNVQSELKFFEAAVKSYDYSIQLNLNEAETFFVRGNALKGLNRIREAIESYACAIKLRPEYEQAYLNKGVAHFALKDFDAALACYQKCIELRPDYLEAYCNQGHVYRALKDNQSALASYDSAIKHDPAFGFAHFDRGDILRDMKRLDEALACYDQAIALNLEDQYVHGIRMYNKMYMCDWSDFTQEVNQLSDAVLRGGKFSAPFPVLGFKDSLMVQSQASRTWIEDKFPLQPTLGAIPKRKRKAKIRLGYYSADFHNHATAYLMAQLFELHDRELFELIAFSFGPDQVDEMRKRVSAAFDSFYDMREKSDQQIAEMSRELQIDIAIDLKGYTTDYRAGIFAFRAAPIQVSYIGFPGTMGAEYIDYIIADRVMIPEQSQPFYSEKVVYMPDSYQVNDRKRVIADTQYSREQLGLPATGFVFCCFNNNYKINPATFDIWMRLLAQVSGSVLWLLQDNEHVVRNLRKEASARGIAPERLVFAPRMSLPEHLARHRAADLFLDTLPCNAHTTASDALWAGLPVLTCMGEAFAARVAGSLLHAMGLPELVTEDLPHYEQLAFELACDPNKLAQLREKLQANRLTTPLFDTARFTRHLESAYQSMMTRYHADLPPEHIQVQRLD